MTAMDYKEVIFVNRDEELIKMMLQMGECITVSVYDADQTHKNRRNTKRAKAMEKLIIENQFKYRKFYEILNNKDTVYYFTLFGDVESMRTVLENYREQFKVMNFYENLEEVLKGKSFDHPVSAYEKRAFKNRGEIYLDNLFEPPASVGSWSLIKSKKDGSYLYGWRNYLCSLCFSNDDRKWHCAIGGNIPIGFLAKKSEFDDLQEAYAFMREYSGAKRSSAGEAKRTSAESVENNSSCS